MCNNINITNGTQKLIIFTALTLITLAVYWQVNYFNFVNFDDPIYVINNNHILSGLTSEEIRWAFGTRYLELWHPLVWLSFMFDYQLYGLKAGGYHLTNLILHVLSTLLLFWLFCRMTGAVWRSAFVAAFFALHPLHVESIAWIAERKDVLSAFFWMLTLCFYVWYTEKPGFKRYLPVLFSFICALMSKPMVVTLPLIMILLDYWPLNRFESKKDNPILWQLKEKAPLFILSAVLIFFTFMIYNPDSSKLTKSFPLGLRLANAPVSFMTYIGKTLWPHDLAVFYPFSDNFFTWQVLGFIILIIIISTAVIAMVRIFPHLFVGWFWYTVTILPVLGITQLRSYAMADRFHYLPSIGISVMLAWSIPLLIKSDKIHKKILFPTVLAIVTVFAVLTWKQCGYWKNSLNLFNHTLLATKNNYLAHANLAEALVADGKDREAIYHYNEAVRIAPYYEVIYYFRGIVYYSMGQKQLAVRDFKEAIRIAPNYEDAHYNIGIVYLDLGLYQDAINNYSNVIGLNPSHAYAYNDRALAYLYTGNKGNGCPDAQKACDLGVCNVLQWARGKGLCR